QALRDRLAELDGERGTAGNRVFYLATPPELFQTIVAQLGDAGLHHRLGEHNFVRLVIEKPFGTDLDSARMLNASLRAVFQEPQVVFDAEPVRDEKLKVLKALRPIPPEQTGEFTLRGQYTSGSVEGTPVASYRGEEKVAPDSWTETFVVMKLNIDNWRWAGTPFYLRHGKRLPKRATEISIQFKRAPQMFFQGEERLE